MDAWDIVKTLLAVASGLGLWILKQEMKKIKEHGRQIAELQKCETIRKARHEAWVEFQAPERRK